MRKLVKMNVDLAIEFEAYERISMQLSACYERASLIVFAIEIPRLALSIWNRQLVFDIESASSLTRARVSGTDSAVRKSLPGSH
jgi:hypothetical protein